MIKSIINKFIIKEYKFKYLMLSIISGILLGLSFQKFNLFFFAWVSFIPLTYCIYKNNLKSSVLYGFVAGITYSLIAFNWMCLFLLKNTETFFNSFIVSAIVWIVLSFYFVIWVAVIKYCSLKIKNNGFVMIMFVSSFWIVLEYIRNYFFGSFPINLVGYSQSTFFPLIQFADVFSIYGISFVIVLINFLLFFWIYNKNKKYLITALIIISLLLVYGFVRINQMSKINYKEEIKIGVIQPNIEQTKRWNKMYKKEIVTKIKNIVEYFKEKNMDIVLYPETVLPGYLCREEEIKDFVEYISSFSNLSLIGGMDVENYKVYNSIFIVSEGGKIVDKYKKKHLVVFGEYIPFHGFFANMFSKLFSNNNLTKEIELKVFNFNRYTLGINICSENYYPYLSRELVLKGATLLTTHSNDAWCDGLSYPYQHFVLNIFRAIENRKYLVVSANTGISGVITPTGKIVRQTKNQEQVCFEETVYTNNYITIYDRIGDLFVYMCMLYVILVFFNCMLFKKKKNA
ncbi:MAG: apolipoprotein N-acyltransferase [Elusimicrobia bacterium]|nr:apolipoprotein N-acyltransferase [Elusimicrobiota bacterium]